MTNLVALKLLLADDVVIDCVANRGEESDDGDCSNISNDGRKDNGNGYEEESSGYRCLAQSCASSGHPPPEDATDNQGNGCPDQRSELGKRHSFDARFRYVCGSGRDEAKEFTRTCHRVGGASSKQGNYGKKLLHFSAFFCITLPAVTGAISPATNTPSPTAS